MAEAPAFAKSDGGVRVATSWSRAGADVGVRACFPRLDRGPLQRGCWGRAETARAEVLDVLPPHSSDRFSAMPAANYGPVSRLDLCHHFGEDHSGHPSCYTVRSGRFMI
jgi:hypothetical protein